MKNKTKASQEEGANRSKDKEKRSRENRGKTARTGKDGFGANKRGKRWFAQTAGG